MTKNKNHEETQRKLKRIEREMQSIYELLKDIRRRLQNLEEEHANRAQ